MKFIGDLRELPKALAIQEGIERRLAKEYGGDSGG
jgi:hypothetical protein